MRFCQRRHANPRQYTHRLRALWHAQYGVRHGVFCRRADQAPGQRHARTQNPAGPARGRADRASSTGTGSGSPCGGQQCPGARDALAEALDEVLPYVEQATFAVAHNIAFDEKILGAEFLRLGRATPFLKKPMHCTMKESTQYCALPGLYGFKYPNLTELHRKLFQKAFEGAHDAYADVRACKAAYYELRTRGVMG